MQKKTVFAFSFIFALDINHITQLKKYVLKKMFLQFSFIFTLDINHITQLKKIRNKKKHTILFKLIFFIAVHN